jgi:hypothetical protein
MIKSFKAYDPKEIALNNHFLDARAKKTSFENVAQEQLIGAHDILHEGSDFGGRPDVAMLEKQIPKQEAEFRIKSVQLQKEFEYGWTNFYTMLSQQPGALLFDELQSFNMQLRLRI